MFIILLGFLLLAAGLHFGAAYTGQQGYVLISLTQGTIETSVTALVVCIALLCIVVFVLTTVLTKGVSSLRSMFRWFGFRKKALARENFNTGLTLLLEGDWVKAEKKLSKYAFYHDQPELCFLFAAEAAHQQHKEILREKYISLSMEHNSDFPANRITHARQLISLNKFDKAHAVLNTLNKKYQKNSVVLLMLKTIYQHKEMWLELEAILPKLKKSRIVSVQEFEQLQQLVYLSQLEAPNLAASDLLICWNKLPADLKKQPVVIESMLRQSLPYHEKQQIQDTMLSLVVQQPTDNNLALVSEMNILDLKATIASVKRLIKREPENIQAHSLLGQLYYKNEQWSEAQQALEKALSTRVDFKDYAYLADALEHQGQSQAANEVSRQAFLLAKSPLKSK